MKRLESTLLIVLVTLLSVGIVFAIIALGGDSEMSDQGGSSPPPIVATPGKGSADLPAHGSVILPAPASDDPTVESPQLRLKISVVDEYTKQPINADVIRVNELVQRDVHFVEVSGLDGAITHTVAITATGYRYVEFELRPRIERHKFVELNVPLEPLRDTG
jgi:hypothetical protein